MLRAERVVRNQIFWRTVNEYIREVAERFDQPGDEPPLTYAFRCECVAKGCRAHVLLTTVEYEAVRADATAFVVSPGHEVASVEQVARRTERFVVVVKIHPEPIRVAIEHDPRAGTRPAAPPNEGASRRTA